YQWLDWRAIFVDVLERPFISVCFTVFVLLIPLAATSTNAMMRRLGRRWQELHRLVYAIAVLVVLHYWWHKAGKNDFAEPLAWALVVGGLLAMRLAWHWARPPATGRPPAPVRVSSSGRAQRTAASEGSAGARRAPVGRAGAGVPRPALRQAPLERE